MTHRRFILSAAAVCLSLGPAACGDPVEPAQATKLGVVTTPTASPKNRVAFTVQPAVQIQDADGDAFAQAGTAITASLTGGGGTLGGTTTATTDANGKATFTDLMITGTVGEKVLTFAAAGLTSATTTVTLVAGDATAIAENAGNNQTAAAGTAVTTAPAVKVSDADGNGVSGVAVTFAVTAGGGSVAGASATTDASGIAKVTSWTLGTTVGTNSLTATATGLSGSPVTFTATGSVGPASQLTKVAGDGQTAGVSTAVAIAPSVKLADANGNGVANATVTFAVASGGGSVTGATQTTNAQGIATVGSWTLGSSAGANTLTASATGVTAATFTATASAVVATPVRFCDSSQLPIWFAYQNGTSGAWTQLAVGANNTYSVPMTSVGAISWVTSSSGTYEHSIAFLSKDELQSFACIDSDDESNYGTKVINGSVSGLGATETADISFGSASAWAYPGAATFSLTDAPDGARDLVALRQIYSNDVGHISTNRAIIRRALNPASGSTLPVLDFGGSEAAATQGGTFTLNGGGTSWGADVSLLTANGTWSTLAYISGSGATAAIPYQVPAATMRLSTDKYTLDAWADGGNTSQYYIQNLTTFGDRTASFGPVLGTPTLTALASTPYRRYRVQLTKQSQYGGFIFVEIESPTANTNGAYLMASAAYFGGTAPATWDISMPDLSSAGFQAIWGLQSSAGYEVDVEAGSTFIMPAANDETPFLWAERYSTAAPKPAGGMKVGVNRPRLPFRARR